MTRTGRRMRRTADTTRCPRTSMPRCAVRWAMRAGGQWPAIAPVEKHTLFMLVLEGWAVVEEDCLCAG